MFKFETKIWHKFQKHNLPLSDEDTHLLGQPELTYILNLTQWGNFFGNYFAVGHLKLTKNTKVEFKAQPRNQLAFFKFRGLKR